MQHAWIDVERPGGSHTALDGKKNCCSRTLQTVQQRVPLDHASVTRKREEGGSQSDGCVCCWGRQFTRKQKNAESGDRQRQTAQRSTKQTQEKAKPTKRGSQQHQKGQKAAKRTEPTTEEKGARGEEGKRRPAEKERGRPGRQQGQREKTAEAKKAGRCSFSGVRHRLRGFWTTQGRI